MSLATEGPKYYFDMSTFDMGDGPAIIFTLVPRYFWHKEQAMDDQGAPRALMNLLEPLGLTELQEWEFEFDGDEAGAEDTRAVLLKNGFAENADFTKMLAEIREDP